jgi:uncharacterized protein YpuA (DUF1002 family)
MSTLNYTRAVATQMSKMVDEFKAANDRFDLLDQIHDLERQISIIVRKGSHLRNAASGAYQAYLIDADYPKLMGKLQQLKHDLNFV